MKQTVKKLFALILVLSLSVVGLIGCAGNSGDSSSGDDSATGELKTFRIGVGGPEGGGIFEGAALAFENGYFEEELAKVGFTPEFVYFSGAGPEINEAFAAGELDAAIVGDFPAFTAKSNGIDNQIIALTNQKQQYGVLVASDDITEPKDLEGKRVIVVQGSVAQFYWESYAEANGIDIDKVEEINAAADATSLLQTGEADAYVVNKYMVAYLESVGLGKTLTTGVDTSDIYTTFIFEATSKVLSENPDLGTAVNKALIRAQEASIEDPESLYNALASEYIPADAWKASYDFDDTLSFLSPEITDEALAYYETLTAWMVDHGIVSEQVDISSFVDTSYYAIAAEELGK